MSPRDRVGRFTEGIEVLKRLWCEDRATFHGQHDTLNDVGLSLKPVQKPRPPIWTAAVVEPGIKRVARIGDTWMITGYPTLTTLQRQMQLYRVGPAGGEQTRTGRVTGNARVLRITQPFHSRN
ncbi:hypothetical protein C2W62_28110 [Candidatus Entotheonella serta]|nr:hypothetical protein C2W62_28110 [Candidatus Entotheonella serta]